MSTKPASDDLIDPAGTSSQDRLRASRRQAIVKALGKGGAVIAAASPLQSYASRNIVTSTGQQCTVSGNQSAAVSASAGTQQICGAYHPRHFIAVSSAFSLGVNDRGLLTTEFQRDAYDKLSPAATLVGAEQLRSNGTAVFIKTSATTMRRVQPSEGTWPSVAPQGTVGSLFASTGSSRTLLAQLYDWSNGNVVGESDLAYFVAAYLNAALNAPPAGFAAAVPFDGAYVQTQFDSNLVNALAFFKLVCKVGNASKPFP